MKLVLVLCATFAICAAEAPLSGPYPVSGWKPIGTQFLLPGQFLPQSRNTVDQDRNVEITKERVNFVGQNTETEEAKAEPQNSYLPPNDSDYVDENARNNEDALHLQEIPQALPGEDESARFNEPVNKIQVHQQYRFESDPKFGRLQAKQQSTFDSRRRQQSGRLFQQPNYQQYQQLQQFQFSRQQAVAPSRKYGPPRNVQLPEDDNANKQDADEDEEQSDNVSSAVQSGRYYVLTPDNTLQRVLFKTSQDAEEARSNGFTAQLKYTPVEPIRDPIYAYNDQGVLVRIYRK